MLWKGDFIVENEGSKDQFTALVNACKNDDPSLLPLEVEGFSVNISFSYRQRLQYTEEDSQPRNLVVTVNPIHLAAYCGAYKVAVKLISQGAILAVPYSRYETHAAKTFWTFDTVGYPLHLVIEYISDCSHPPHLSYSHVEKINYNMYSAKEIWRLFLKNDHPPNAIIVHKQSGWNAFKYRLAPAAFLKRLVDKEIEDFEEMLKHLHISGGKLVYRQVGDNVSKWIRYRQVGWIHPFDDPLNFSKEIFKSLPNNKQRAIFTFLLVCERLRVFLPEEIREKIFTEYLMEQLPREYVCTRWSDNDTSSNDNDNSSNENDNSSNENDNSSNENVNNDSD